MMQMLLMPDPRPLVERLGREFFRQAPEGPGVYLMRDAADTVLYVGKARNLRKRLASYRVANPDRMPRRHLRLVRAVTRIDLQECPDESSALARESELLRGLRPRFNRAGTWPGVPRFLGWRITSEGMDLAVMAGAEHGWVCHGPLAGGAIPLHARLVRLLWCVLQPERGLAGMPAGWFHGWHSQVATIPCLPTGLPDLSETETRLKALFAGQVEEFAGWFRERISGQSQAFERAANEMDLEEVSKFVGKKLSL